MHEYSFKRGFEASEDRLVEALEANFDSFEKKGKKYTATISNAKFEIELKGKKLMVSTVNAGEGSSEVIKRYNRFLEALTGYTAKERRKKMLKVKEMNSNSP
jgi:hypothetical protein